MNVEQLIEHLVDLIDEVKEFRQETAEELKAIKEGLGSVQREVTISKLL